MFDFLKPKSLSLATVPGLSRDAAAKILRTSPELLAAFEDSYRKHEATRGVSDNLFAVNAKQMASLSQEPDMPLNLELQSRIVSELLEQTETLYWDGSKFTVETFHRAVTAGTNSDCTDLTLPAPVTATDIDRLPKEIRPQLAGHLMRRDMGNEPSYPMLLNIYGMYLKERAKPCPDTKKMKTYYDIFRQGLDILDLDEITYEIIGTNPNSMGNWLPQIATASAETGFFKIPKTRIVKVPLSLLQLTRTEYTDLTPATKAIADEYCRQAFSLDPNGNYFIKTGTLSSKFDFRNAHVVTPEEVADIGQYLLFIHHQALCHAHYDLSGRGRPACYGMSTTVEWVVREYIPSTAKGTIYHGLPIRPEYRIFVDFDTCKVIGANPYWDPAVMKERFEQRSDAGDMDQMHDSLMYRMAEPYLMEQYQKNISDLSEHLEVLLKHTNGLTGQWSVDIMQEGDDFYIIDMALAENSAFYNCVPAALRAPTVENWLPMLPDGN